MQNKVITQNICAAKRSKRVLNFLKKNIVGWGLLAPAAFCIYFFAIRPTFSGIIWSFFDMKGYTITDFAGLDNYRRVLTDPLFFKILGNTLMYVLLSLIIGFCLPIIIALFLGEIRLGKNTFRFFTYFPCALPGVAVFMLWYFIYYPNEGGLLNMLLLQLGFEPYVWLQDPRYTILYIIITMTWNGAGATAIYYYAALQGINKELYEASIIDGAGFFNRVRHVSLPQISGVLLLMLVTQIINVFSIMEQPLQMTDGGPNNASMTLGLLSYRYGFVAIRPQLAMAVGTIMFLILIGFTCFYFYLNKKVEENAG